MQVALQGTWLQSPRVGVCQIPGMNRRGVYTTYLLEAVSRNQPIPIGCLMQTHVGAAPVLRFPPTVKLLQVVAMHVEGAPHSPPLVRFNEVSQGDIPILHTLEPLLSSLLKSLALPFKAYTLSCCCRVVDYARQLASWALPRHVTGACYQLLSLVEPMKCAI